MPHSIPLNTLNPEERILLASLQYSWSDSDRKDLANSLIDITDWDCYKARAVDTYLGTTVYVRLVKQLKLKFPEHVLKVLESMYFQVLVKNTQLIEAYDTLALAFNKLELSYIPLKGIHFLRESFSNDIGIRQLSDIDMLFQPDDAEKVHKCLLELGYRAYLTMPIRISKLLKNPTPYNYSKDGVTLDVHYALNRLENFDISMREVWESSTQNESAFERFLSSEDQLIHLCTHAFLHMKIYDLKQISFLDIVTLLNNDELNWELLKNKMSQYRCQEETASMLFLASRYFNSEVPLDIIEPLSEEQKEKLNNQFLLLLREDKTKLKSTHYKLKDRYFQFFHLLSWTKRILFVFYYIFPDKPYLKQLFGSKQNVFILWLKHIYQNSLQVILSPKRR
ncbi:MAG: hypothetical protein RLZZ91_435 [Bacteroidota bacterium]|jgi:hypothetical protein